MAELVAENTFASLIPQCLAAVEILHEFLAKDNFCQLGRERIKSETTSGLYILRGPPFEQKCRKKIHATYLTMNAFAPPPFTLSENLIIHINSSS